MATDLELAIKTLLAKQRPYETAWLYFDGPQPIRYSTARLKNMFSKINARFSENWVAVVVNSVLERLELERFDVMNESGQDVNTALTDRLNDLWTQTQMDGDEDDIEVSMLVTGEGYAIAWPDDENGQEIQAFYNDSRNAHVFYKSDNPKEKRFAAKWWEDEDMHWRLTLYYPDRLEYYRTTNKMESISGVSTGAFQSIDKAVNPYEVIPVFHWRLVGRRNKSLIANVVESQDAINKLLNDMMVSSEFGSFKQRYVVTNAEIGKLKNAPNEIWKIPAGDGISEPTKVGEFDTTELANYIQGIQQISTYIAIVEHLPKHYLFSQGGDPSGEALIAMESPLNKKCQTIIDKRLVPVYREMAAFLLQLDGAAVDKTLIVPKFTRPETVQPMTRARMLLDLTNSGAGMEGAASVAGYAEDEVDKLAKLDNPWAESLARATNGQQPASDDAAPENIESTKGLNGIQIRAAVELLEKVIADEIPPSTALELLVSLGIERERAQRMVDDADKFVAVNRNVVPEFGENPR